jgi:hypothetical protein
MHVFLAGCRFQVGEQDHCVAQLSLLPSIAHIYIVNIEGIFSKALIAKDQSKTKIPI